MKEAIKLPDAAEIQRWAPAMLKRERIRLRNELAFIHGDRAHGGPAQEDLVGMLRSRIAAIDVRLGEALPGVL
jgi:hypothetical protein